MRTLLVVLALTCGCKNGTPDAASTTAASASSTPAPPAVASVAPPAPVASASGAAPAAAAPTATAGNTGSKKWDFESDKAGGPPAGFAFGRTGDGREGKWLVRADGGGNVLAQTDADTSDYRFPIAWTSEPAWKDLEIEVRCKPVSGTVDRACGLVFRLKDANNYYLTRANALENNIRLYTVKDGKRQQLASYSGKVTGNAWHVLRAVAKGDHFEVHWDGAKVLEHRDATFADAGAVGVWTKADSVTYFDDLSVKPAP